MISKLLRRAAAVAIAAGMTAAAPTAVAVAAPAATHTASAQLSCLDRGFLNDGSGQGTAMSLYPHTAAYDTEPFTQQSDSDAWEMCYNSDGTLRPESAPTMCAANDNNNVKLHTCNGHNDQQWTIPNVPGSFNVRSSPGGYLCAGGGVKSADIVATLAGCHNSYHNTWEFIAG